jgi:fructose-1,6-bisphosphatase/inositol monophosphatase family enzyme
VTVVLDPVDGSTNASRGLPWFATSLCAVDGSGPLAAVVVNQATGTRFEAVRDEGARCDGRPVSPSGCTTVGRALLGLSSMPARNLGWEQYRALGAAALDLCAVAAGALDGYIGESLAPWDYLGALLVCQEAGAAVADGDGRHLVVLEHGARRAVVAASTPSLLAELLEARRSASGGSGKIS